MKNALLGIVLIVLSCGCFRVDTTNVNSFGEEVLKIILDKDSIALKKHQTDTSFFSFSDFKDYLNKYSKSNFEIIKIDTSIIQDSRYIDVFYKIDTSIHKLECLYVRDKFNNILINGLWLNNLNQDCAQYLSKPFKPSSFALQPQGISWRSGDYYIKNLKIKIYNADIINDYKNVKLKIRIQRDGNEIINRTIQVPGVIFSGDTYEFTASEVEGTFINPSLTSKNVSYNIDFLESDHPKNDWCEELLMIKSFIKKNRVK